METIDAATGIGRRGPNTVGRIAGNADLIERQIPFVVNAGAHVDVATACNRKTADRGSYPVIDQEGAIIMLRVDGQRVRSRTDDENIAVDSKVARQIKRAACQRWIECDFVKAGNLACQLERLAKTQVACAEVAIRLIDRR